MILIKGQLDTSNWDYELGSIRGVEQETLC